MDFLNVTSVLREGLWAIFLFLIACAALYWVLAREKSLALGAAIRRSLTSFFTSPVGYLRKTIDELALGKANPRLRDTDHYLLNRFISNVQIALVTAVVLGGGLIITSAVFSSLPSPYLRQGLSSAKDELKQAEDAPDKVEDTVKQQDKDWQSRSSELIRGSEDDHRQKVAAAQNAVTDDERLLQNSADAAKVLPSLQNFFQSHPGDPSAADQAKQFVQRLPSLPEQDTTALLAYCDHWAALQSLSSVTPKSTDAIRSRVQPDHASLVEQLQGLKEDVARAQAAVQERETEVGSGYKPSNFIFTIVFGALMVLIYVWAVGLAIELFSMGFYLSNDVKQIRSEIEKSDTKGAAATAGAGK